MLITIQENFSYGIIIIVVPVYLSILSANFTVNLQCLKLI
jgi:hypothetical protein